MTDGTGSTSVSMPVDTEGGDGDSGTGTSTPPTTTTTTTTASTMTTPIRDTHDDETSDDKPRYEDEDEKDADPYPTYAAKKTLSNSAMNVALFMANVSQVKVLVKTSKESRDEFFTPLVVLITFSLIFQVAVAIVLLMLGMKTKKATFLNNVSTILVFLITAINLVISGLGLGYNSSVFNPFNLTAVNGSILVSPVKL